MCLLRASLCVCYVHRYVFVTCIAMCLLRASLCVCYVHRYVFVTCFAMCLLRASLCVCYVHRYVFVTCIAMFSTKIFYVLPTAYIYAFHRIFTKKIKSRLIILCNGDYKCWMRGWN